MGVDNLERYLKVQDIKPVSEKLIEFEDKKLNRVIPKTSLNVYDSILFESKSEIEDHES
jgi:rRNA pseudouridine-1189 N-methylase Emg1 (Nep1/Mra1 family)